MLSLTGSKLPSMVSLIMLVGLIFQSCTISSQVNSNQAVYHFGDSPCGETFMSNPKAQIEIKRKITHRAFPKLMQGVEGDLVMAIAINTSGKVTYAEYLPDLSSVKDKQSIMSAIEAITKTTFAEDPDAAENECGLWTMRLKEN